MARCGFETDIVYRDEKTGKSVPYVCPEPEENDGLCIFHDEKYLTDPKNIEIARSRLTNRIDECISNKKALICIGFHLPDFSFGNIHFDMSIDFRDAVFVGRIDFYLAQFIKEANFSGAQFSGEVYFSGAQFSGEAEFSEVRFTKRAEFSEVRFTGGANFSQAHFTEAANFGDAQFTGVIRFYNAQFTGGANFSGVQFSGEADFSEALFSGGANFSGVQFAKEANFSGVQFAKEANFSGVQFAKEANFSGAQFSDRANFSAAQFTEKADFSQALFTGYANFSGARFTRGASFSAARFTRGANFSAARFTGITVFIRAQFPEYANFYGVRFTRGASFYGVRFTRGASFYGAQFTGRARFILAYVKEAVFTKAKFEEAVFHKTQFADKADFSEIQSTTKKAYPHLDFHHVQFDVPEQVIFLKDNLSEVSFVNTDITRVRFGEDIVWGNKFKIREERKIEEQLRNKNIAVGIQLGDVIAVYRNLRENYEFRMRYSEAGEFFIREMEMKRLYGILSSQSWKNIFRLKWRIKDIQSIEKNVVILEKKDWMSRNISLSGLYYHLSRYGQSFSRPTLFGIGIVALSTVLWFTQPNHRLDFSVGEFLFSQTNFTIPHLQDSFERSIVNFIPLLPSSTGIQLGLIDYIFKIVGGAVTFGLIIIALRRKFERKFRH